jgi:cyclophilin family peptidyl-prolyl cis-trans isomerase
LSFKIFVLGLIGFATAHLLAQSTETGPQGYAEPKLKPFVVGEAPPPPPPTADNTLNIQLSTGGVVSIELRPDKAPKSVERVKTLTARKFYDGTIFHRVIEGFMAQGGDPKGTGEGGSDLPDLKAEFNDLPHVRGAMAMARADAEDSANSQFYIMLAPNLSLDRKYTVIGRVYRGMSYVDGIAKGEPPAHPTKIIHAWIGDPPADAATPPVEDAPAPAAPIAGVPTTLGSAGGAPGVAAAPAPAAPAPAAAAPKTAAKKKPK